MEILTFANQKGGVGKTTTALVLAQGLALKKKKKVLLIDIDPQCNLTNSFKELNLAGFTSVDLFNSDASEKIKDFIQHDQDIKNLDIIPATINLTNLTTELVQKAAASERLKYALEGLEGLGYDFVIIDTPPALSILTLNTFVAADSVIIPVQGDSYSLQGLGQLYQTLMEVKKFSNNKIKIDGILLVRNKKSNLSNAIGKELENIAQQLNTKTYKVVIRDTVTIKEAQTYLESIFTYNPKSIAVEDYTAFLNEFLTGR